MSKGILYIIAILLANLTAGYLITSFGITFALGTLFFGVIFTLRDMMHIELGRKKTYLFIGLAVLVSALFSFIGTFDPRILLASISALLLSETLDTEIFHTLRDRSFWIRVLSSNIVSIIIDTVLFTLIAFYGIWSTPVLIAVILGDIIIKFTISALLLLVKRK